MIKKVDIRPGVSVLAVLRHLNYTPWFALAEFVDNAVQSFQSHRKDLEKAEGKGAPLRVDIDIVASSPTRISIRDNAAGIYPSEFPRAFRPAAIPPDRTGLAEFGMGMKSAACWFAPKWQVRTSALGEPISRKVYFDIQNIVTDDIQELSISEETEKRERHYTEVVLEDVFQIPVGRTIAKLKEHLTDIYRVYLREGWLKLYFNGEALKYDAPPVLQAPYFREKSSPSRKWYKEIEFDFGAGLSVSGFAALREPASTSRAGFALFRRGRLIQGSGDEGYRPPFIFGQSNSYRYQRLFGELHLEGFDVSHTKDGFRWDENELPFLGLLRDHLDSGNIPLLKQAEGYRSRVARNELATAAKQAIASTSEAMQSRLPDVLPIVSDAPKIETATEKSPEQPKLAGRRFDIKFKTRQWSINIEITNDPAESQWLALSDSRESEGNIRRIDIRLSMAHPFMVRFAQGDPEELEGMLRVSAAIALGEILARDAGVRSAGTVRRNINEILREALSDP